MSPQEKMPVRHRCQALHALSIEKLTQGVKVNIAPFPFVSFLEKQLQSIGMTCTLAEVVTVSGKMEGWPWGTMPKKARPLFWAAR